MPTKKPPARKKPAPRRARRSAPRFHLPTLQQRQLDLIGLGLVALALFFAFLVYFGWDGGRAGSQAVEGLRWLLGAAHYLVPVALAAGGAILMLRPVLPAVRPFRSGAICVFVAVTLGLSAGTLGVGPGGTRPEWWDAEWVKTRGGMTGETLDWVVTTLAGTVGAHILAVFLFIAGVLLLTGASVAGVIKATSDSVSTTTRELRTAVASKRPRPTDDLATLERSTRVRVERPEIFGETPEFEPPAKPKRAPKKKAGAKDDDDESFWSGEERFPDLYGAEGPPPEEVAEPEPEHVAELSRLAEDPVEDEPGVTRGPSEPVAQEQLTPQGRYRKDVTDSPDFIWQLPDASKLTRSTEEASRPDTAGQEKVAAQLVEALGHFNVEARVIGMVAGPHITRYELRLAPGIKVGKVAQLKDDLAYALAAADIRILAPIPGKQAVGIEVPNARRRIVHLGDVFQAPPEDWSPLTVWLGKDVAGRSIGADLAKMPHLLVAGTTGAGKSGAINAMLSSILLQATPHEVRMVLVDPKQVELTHYDSIPHLLTPVITSPRQAATALQNLVREMEQRYSYMALARTRTLKDLNNVRISRDEQPLPYILCVIDELADLMMVAPADVEDSIIRIAQKARAVGIHLVLATQSPRVDVITGMIKANVPSRIAFAVTLADRLARDPRPERRRVAARHGRHALLAGRLLAAAADPGRVHRRGPDRGAHPRLAAPGRARAARGPARRGRGRRGRVQLLRRRVRSRRGPAAVGRDPARRRDADRLDVDAPAPDAARLHARRALDRHARAPRGHLRLRRIQAAPGARHRGRSPARDRCLGRRSAAGSRRRRSARVGHD